LIQSINYISCLSSLLLTRVSTRLLHVYTTKVRVNLTSGMFGGIVDHYSASQEAIEPAQYVSTAVDPRAQGTTDVPHMRMTSSLIDVVVNVPDRHSFQGFKTDADIRDVHVLLDDQSVRPLGHLLLRPSTRETVVFKPRVGQASEGQQVRFTVPDGTLPVYVVLRHKDTGTFVNHVLFPTQAEKESSLAIAEIGTSVAATADDSQSKRARLKQRPGAATRAAEGNARAAGSATETGAGQGAAIDTGTTATRASLLSEMSIADLAALAKRMRGSPEHGDVAYMSQVVSELRSRFNDRQVLNVRRLRVLYPPISFLYPRTPWTDDDEMLYIVLTQT
jgi:hypothetical protein